MFIKSIDGNIELPEMLMECSISEETFYQNFKDLNALLIEIMQAEAHKIATCVYNLPNTHEQLMDVLYLMGLNTYDVSTDSETGQLEFIMLLRAKAFPNIARQFYDHYYGHCVSLIQTQLGYACSKDLFSAEFDDLESAETLFSLWQCLNSARTRLGLSEFDIGSKEHHVKSGIEKVIIPYMQNKDATLEYLKSL